LDSLAVCVPCQEYAAEGEPALQNRTDATSSAILVNFFMATLLVPIGPIMKDHASGYQSKLVVRTQHFRSSFRQ
jgi:hypothetical protein